MEIWSKKTFIFRSSCIYPKFSKQPICEESYYGDLEETNIDTLAKISGIKLCELLRRQYNLMQSL